LKIYYSKLAYGVGYSGQYVVIAGDYSHHSLQGEKTITHRSPEVDSGARNVDHILTDALLPELSRRILEHMAQEIKIATIHVGVDDQGFVFDFNTAQAPSPGTAADAMATVINKSNPAPKARKQRKARSSEPVH
jgi:hypothetical protein